MSTKENQSSLHKDKKNFACVANALLNDNSLNWADKGIYAYIESKPSGWDFSAYRIAEDSNQGHKTVMASLRRLESAGWLSRHKLQSGRTTYHLHFAKVPLGSQPDGQSAKKGTISNKETNKQRGLSKKEKNKESPSASVSEFFLFNAYKRNESPRKSSKAFYHFLKVHDTYWKQKHNPIKDETIRKYSLLAEKLIDCDKWQIKENAMEFFDNKKTGDSQFPLFVHWLYGQQDEDYRGFDGEGNKLTYDKMMEYL